MYKQFDQGGGSCRPPGSSPYRPLVWASFSAYVEHRRYDYGRGTPEAWRFIAFARGTEGFPDPTCWRDLQVYLESIDADASLVKAAKSVWKSYTAGRSRADQAAGLRRMGPQ